MNPLHGVRASENEGSDASEHESFKIQSEALSDASNTHVENKVAESLPGKHGSYYDLPATKLSELMKLGDLQTASTQSLLYVVKTILDENIEKSSSNIPMRVASLLKFTMQEIDQRVSKESEIMKKQGSINKSREERYQSKIRALETLTAGTTEENKIITNQLQQIKIENARIEEEKKLEHQNMIRLKENYEIQISSMKQELELTKKTHENNTIQLKSHFNETIAELERKISSMKQELDLAKKTHENNTIQLKSHFKETIAELEWKISSMKQELDLAKRTHENSFVELKSQHKETIAELEWKISLMKQELDLAKRTHENNIVELKSQHKETIAELEMKIVELECLLADSLKKVKKVEELSESKYMRLKKKELHYKHYMDSHIGSIQDLRKASDSIKQDMLNTKRFYVEELNHFEIELKELVDAAQNYHNILTENRSLYNEVQDLKGNIRVYCRVRPFLHDQSKKKTTIDYIGENGELVVANHLKQGKDTHRMFKFDKVFGPSITQEDVFRDTQPLIRSVLDGYNVCIFAYGQTGSGKTYTMTGPSLSSVEHWGVNYRALNDLFNISQSRKSYIAYEVSVQMVEIYNEQVRDLLSNGSSQKRLGIWNTTQPSGLAVPDASVHEVKSTADVLELMNIGLMSRAICATALNERSSRSHSVLTVHVQGTDLETNVVLCGNLHLVDLAGSERVDRSEVTGDRLREAQHINKSLSALGDVIFALAQKSPHVPFRNSKLTQVLQSSLGGQAKTLMFVQLNPDVESYSETVSTLKFAERVSGVELGAARSNKEGRDVRQLIEQVASLKDTITRKDEEIGHLRQLKTNLPREKRITNKSRYGPPPSPGRHSLGSARPLRRTSSEQSSRIVEKLASELDHSSDYSDKHSDAGSQQSTDELKHHQEFFLQSLTVVDGDHSVPKELESSSSISDQILNLNDDIDLLRFEDGDDEERLSDISDSVLSMAGTETDGSNSIVEYIMFPETPKPPPEIPPKPIVSEKLRKPLQKPVLTGSSRPFLNKNSSKVSSSKKTNAGSSTTVKSSKRRQ